jgi:hypothetical protein
MNKYRVSSDQLELPQGCEFKTMSIVPIKDGSLVLLSVGGALTVARWYYDVAGRDWAVQPGRLIGVAGQVSVRILGVVIPV